MTKQLFKQLLKQFFKKRLTKFLSFGLLISLATGMITAISLRAYSFEIPELTGPVIDEVGLLNANTKRQLAGALFNLHKEQGVQLQIYITKSLQGEQIESAAIKIFDKWKLGDEKSDKGLLFLVAPNEKRLRIEVGQGLEGDIPDVIAKRIIADIVRPYFQRNEFNLGIVQGVAALQTYLGNADAKDTKLDPNQVQEAQGAEKAHKKSGGVWVILIAIGIWLIIFMLNPSLALYLLFAAMSGGRGGSGGGGSWSGGGGKSSGGGASGGW